MIGKTTADASFDPVSVSPFTDRASEKDELGLNKYIEGLASYIQKCETPVTISLQGGWGTGKTTLFNLVASRLPSEKCHVIEINTWQFSVAGYRDSLVYILMMKLLDKLTDMASDGPEKDELSNLAARVSRVLHHVREATPALAAGFVEAVSNSSTLGEAAKERVGELLHVDGGAGSCNGDLQTCDYGAVDELRASLDGVIRDVCGPDKRIVVFIDDLDRLEPEKALELLEGVKNFMDCAGCVYVLAIDEEVVFDGIRKKYGDRFDQSDRKQRFFDKIIQVPFQLPIYAYDLTGFVKSQLGEGDQDPDTVQRFVHSAQILFPDKNPRSIKRCFSLLRLHEEIRSAGSEERGALAAEERAMLFSVVAFQMRSSSSAGGKGQALDDLVHAARRALNSDDEMREMREFKQLLIGEDGGGLYEDLVLAVFGNSTLDSSDQEVCAFARVLANSETAITPQSPESADAFQESVIAYFNGCSELQLSEEGPSHEWRRKAKGGSRYAVRVNPREGFFTLVLSHAALGRFPAPGDDIAPARDSPSHMTIICYPTVSWRSLQRFLDDEVFKKKE